MDSIWVDTTEALSALSKTNRFLVPGYNLSKFCGGVIIDNSWILSAAHCFETYAGGKVKLNVYINAGVTEAYDRGANSQLVQVAQIFDHPNYDPQ